MGTRPCRLGRAKLVCPLPPKVVPRSENSAWFWLIGSSCPLQNAHPFGGKLNDMTLISDRNGSAMGCSLVARGRRGGRRGGRHGQVVPAPLYVAPASFVALEVGTG